MSIVDSSNRKAGRSPRSATIVEVPIRVSLYDRASGLLIALLVLIGGSVALLFLAWLMARIVFRPGAQKINWVEPAAGRGDHAEGFARELEAPGEEELLELREPQLQTAIEAVTDAVSSVLATTDAWELEAAVTTKGERGLGDSRPPGPMGEGEDIIPRWERWEIRWASSGLNTYAQQLDHFGIELGAVGGGRNGVDYASRLTQFRPESRTGPSKDETRLYMTWKAGTLRRFDVQLLERAGVDSANRTIMQFYPRDVEELLARVELEHAKKQGRANPKDFLRTVFAVRPAGRGYEFHVVEQRFRPPPA